MTSNLVQTLLVLLIVGGAALYVGRRLWRTIAAARASRTEGCGVGCGCDDASARPSTLGVRRSTEQVEVRGGVTTRSPSVKS